MLLVMAQSRQRRMARYWISILSVVMSLTLTATASASARDTTLKAFLRGYLGTFGPVDKTTRITAASIPNDDIIVLVSGNSWCGSGGCNMLILKRVQKTYRILGHETIVQLPIRLLRSRTNGEPDIGVTVCGGGILRCYESVLSFNAGSYPENPSVSPAKHFNDVRGAVIITSIRNSSPLYR